MLSSKIEIKLKKFIDVIYLFCVKIYIFTKHPQKATIFYFFMDYYK